MCGITGWVAFDSDLRAERAAIDAMTETMSDRGPDSVGTWVDQHVALGHRRLSVIDLPGGKQPMSVDTPQGRVVLVYSGEVYNFRELREELVVRGHHFSTSSDTEVVLHCYLEWGQDAALRLNGMFAFALWDARIDRLVLVRDRMGVKPLYFHATKDGMLFGSEPKAILANRRFERVVDVDCLRELTGFTKSPGWSLWKDMYEVEPGTLVSLDRDGIKRARYWRLEATPHTDDAPSSIDRVRELLTDTLGRQVVSDVPQCTLLSGGLDSSAVTALAARKLDAGGEKVRSFSVDFTGYEENFQPDEKHATTPDSPFIREVSDHVGSLHRDIVLDSNALLDPSVRRAVVAARDIPIGLGDIDASMLLLFRAIKPESTVALSGEFADELFGGYPWFHHEAARDAETFPWLAFQNTYTADRTRPLQPELRAQLDIDTYVADEYATAVNQVDYLDGEQGLERRMRTICHLHLTRLVQALLDRKDRLSMAAGVEVRVPFADHRLVEYVYNTPWSLKTADGREKSLLRQAMAQILPTSVVDRVKSPYPSTQDMTYPTALQEQLREVHSDVDHQVFDVFDPHWVEEVAAADPDTVTGAVRTGVERVLDFHAWIDLYRPDLRLGHSSTS